MAGFFPPHCRAEGRTEGQMDGPTDRASREFAASEAQLKAVTALSILYEPQYCTARPEALLEYKTKSS